MLPLLAIAIRKTSSSGKRVVLEYYLCEGQPPGFPDDQLPFPLGYKVPGLSTASSSPRIRLFVGAHSAITKCCVRAFSGVQVSVLGVHVSELYQGLP